MWYYNYVCCGFVLPKVLDLVFLVVVSEIIMFSQTEISSRPFFEPLLYNDESRLLVIGLGIAICVVAVAKILNYFNQP